MPAQYERWQLVEDALYDLITAQAVPGGQLPLIARVGRTATTKRGLFPYAGVQFLRYEESRQGFQGVHQLVYTYAVSIIIRAAFDPTQPDTEETVLASLTQYISDGYGNGMSVLLSSNPNLAGANSSYITSLDRGLAEGESAQSGTLAMALYTFKVEDQVTRF